jgi:hypothetical protein
MSFENDAPVDLSAVTVYADARLAFLANTSLTNPAIEADEVELANGDRVLLAAQNTPSQGGLYTLGPTGAEKSPGGTFADDVTPISVTGLTASQSYVWVKGAGTVSLTNGGDVLTASGLFVAAGTSVTLLGLEADPVADSVKAALLTRATDANQDAEIVRGRRVRISAGVQYAGAVFACAVEGTTAISDPAAIPFVLISSAAPEPDPDVTFANDGPVDLAA